MVWQKPSCTTYQLGIELPPSPRPYDTCFLSCIICWASVQHSESVPFELVYLSVGIHDSCTFLVLNLRYQGLYHWNRRNWSNIVLIVLQPFNDFKIILQLIFLKWNNMFKQHSFMKTNHLNLLLFYCKKYNM